MISNSLQMPEAHPRARRSHLDWTFVLLLAYALLVPVLIVRLGDGAAFGAVDVLFPLALLVLLRQLTSRISSAEIFAGIFAISAAFSTIAVLLGIVDLPVGSAPFDVLVILRVFEIYAPFFIVIGWTEWSEGKAKKIVVGAMWSGLAACAIGIVLHLAGIQIRDAQQVNWYGEGLGSSLRAGGLLGNSSDFGHLAALLGTCALTLGVLYRVGAVLLLTTLAAAGTAVTLSTSRAAILHLLIALMLMIPSYLRGRRALAVVAFSLTGIMATAIFFSMNPFDPRVEAILQRLDFLNITGSSSFYSSTTRVNTWDQMIELLLHQPFTGIGYGMTLGNAGSAGDNSFLSMIVEIGILGGIAYAAFWLANLVDAVGTPRSTARAAAVALIVSEMSHMLTVDTHRMWATTPLSLVFIALALRECHRVRAIHNAAPREPRVAGGRRYP